MYVTPHRHQKLTRQMTWQTCLFSTNVTLFYFTMDTFGRLGLFSSLFENHMWVAQMFVYDVDHLNCVQYILAQLSNLVGQLFQLTTS